MMRGRGARGPYCGDAMPRAMYLRMVLRSRPVRSAIADTDKPSLCRSRITINSLSVIMPAPRAVNPATDHEPAGDPAPHSAKRSGAGTQTGENSTDDSGEY